MNLKPTGVSRVSMPWDLATASTKWEVITLRATLPLSPRLATRCSRTKPSASLAEIQVPPASSTPKRSPSPSQAKPIWSRFLAISLERFSREDSVGSGERPPYITSRSSLRPTVSKPRD